MNSNEGKLTTGLCTPGIRLPFSFFFFSFLFFSFLFFFFSFLIFTRRTRVVNIVSRSRSFLEHTRSSASGFLWIERTIADNRRNIDITSRLRSAFLDTRCRGCLLHLDGSLHPLCTGPRVPPDEVNRRLWFFLFIKSSRIGSERVNVNNIAQMIISDDALIVRLS